MIQTEEDVRRAKRLCEAQADMNFRNGVNLDVWRFRRGMGWNGIDVRDDALQVRGRLLKLKRDLARAWQQAVDLQRSPLLRRQAS